MRRKIAKRISLVVAAVFSLCFLMPDMNVQATTTTSDGFVMSGDTLIRYEGQGGTITAEMLQSANVKSIGEMAFANSNIKGVSIPNTVTSIGKDAFAGSSVEQVVITGSGSLQIAAGAFSKCASLTNVKLTDVSTIGAEMFKECKSLSTVMMSGVQTIGNDAFNKCEKLTEINLSGVQSIGTGAFAYSGLGVITIPGTVKTLGSGAFQGCNKLSEATIADGVTAVPGYLFNKCDSLTSITLPSSVTTVAAGAFADCNSLATVAMLGNVSSIDTSAFSGSGRLTTISVKNSSTYSDEDGCLYNNDKSKLIYVPAGKGSINWPSNIKIIGKGAFKDNKSISNLKIPSGVTTIEEGAFSESGIKTVEIPESVTSIGSQSDWNPDKIKGATDSRADRFADLGDYPFESTGQAQNPLPPDSSGNGGNSGNDGNGGNGGNSGNGEGNSGNGGSGGTTVTGPKLKSLAVSSGTLSPAFSADNVTYRVTVNSDVSSIEVKAEAADSSAKVEGVGRYSLNYGENTIKVVVKSGGGASAWNNSVIPFAAINLASGTDGSTQTTYTIIVTRLNPGSNGSTDGSGSGSGGGSSSGSGSGSGGSGSGGSGSGSDHVKDDTPKTADIKIDAKYFLFAGVLLVGVYLVVSRRSIKKNKSESDSE